ncbi:MAG: aminotransferase class IV [Bacteroidales bacterium]|nr:aminotransferase class IV [Bacteroidales bacterium]
MSLPKYCLLDGELTSFKTGLSQTDLLLNWMPGTLELRWRASGTRIPFFYDQYLRLKSAIHSFCDDLTWLPEPEQLKVQLVKLIQGNRLFKGIEIRFLLKPGLTIHKRPELLILSLPHPDELFVLNSQGLVIGSANPPLHPGRSFILQLGYNRIKTRQWEVQAANQELDILYFTSHENQLLETIDSNIFLIKGNKLFTPSNNHLLNPWGINESIKKACTNLGINYSATPSLLTNHINQADEVFLANDYHGIRWVMGHQDKRFFRKNSREILNLINQDWKDTI